MTTSSADPRTAAALKRWPYLPGDANVRVRVVAAVYGVSTATVWRWARNGLLPAPHRRGGVTAWNVGQLRANLAAREA